MADSRNRPPKCPEQAPAEGGQGNAVEAGAQGHARQLKELQLAPAQVECQNAQTQAAKAYEQQVRRHRGCPGQMPQLPQQVIGQAQAHTHSHRAGKPKGLLRHRGGHQPKSREKKLPSRRGSS